MPGSFEKSRQDNQTCAILGPMINHVLVDFENVCTIDLEIFRGHPIALTLLLGARQTKLDAALVEQLLAHASAVEMVRLTSNGKNALDFALAHHLGRAVAASPQAHYHIVSKDTGFDPLVEFLTSRKVKVRRHSDFEALKQILNPPTHPVGSAAFIDEVLAHLRKSAKSRPKKRTTLESNLKARFPSTASHISRLIDQLVAKGSIQIDSKNSIEYRI